MARTTVLLVDDEPALRDAVGRALRLQDYDVTAAPDGSAALDELAGRVFDLVVLDVSMPAPDGLEICRRLRSAGDRTPVLMLTARDGIDDRVAGLDAGADDYLVKPFHLVELLARVRALLRRAPRAQPPVLHAQGVSLDPATRTATRAGRTIVLTAKEFAVLEYLMRNAGHIISTTELIDHAWDSNYEGFSNVVQTYIRYLRQKLTLPGEKDIIETRRGAGYVIAADA